MKLGFTGTREKLTDAQTIALRAWLESSPPTEFHHGACLGADVAAVLQVKSLYGSRVKAVAYPGHIPSMTSGPAMAVSDERKPPVYTLSRNKHVVEASEVLLACPEGPEKLKSGTWATIRYARKMTSPVVPVVVVWPDGTVEDSRTKTD